MIGRASMGNAGRGKPGSAGKGARMRLRKAGNRGYGSQARPSQGVRLGTGQVVFKRSSPTAQAYGEPNPRKQKRMKRKRVGSDSARMVARLSRFM